MEFEFGVLNNSVNMLKKKKEDEIVRIVDAVTERNGSVAHALCESCERIVNSLEWSYC